MSAEEIHKHKPKEIKPQGTGSGLDADKLDGSDYSAIFSVRMMGTLANRPSPTPNGLLYTATDTKKTYIAWNNTWYNFVGTAQTNAFTNPEQGATILFGNDASKPTPKGAGDLYYASDTEILYCDVSTGGWGEIARGESVTRLAYLAEKAHGSLTGVTSDQHHAKVHNLAHVDHPDVNIASPVDGQLLMYDGGTGKWINADPNVSVVPHGTHVKKIDLTATGIIHTPTSGKKVRILAFTWSSNADIVTALRFGTAGDLLFAIQAKGVIGLNLIGAKLEGSADEALYGYLSGTGTMKGTVLIEEV